MARCDVADCVMSRLFRRTPVAEPFFLPVFQIAVFTTPLRDKGWFVRLLSQNRRRSIQRIQKTKSSVQDTTGLVEVQDWSAWAKYVSHVPEVHSRALQIQRLWHFQVGNQSSGALWTHTFVRSQCLSWEKTRGNSHDCAL